MHDAGYARPTDTRKATVIPLFTGEDRSEQQSPRRAHDFIGKRELARRLGMSERTVERRMRDRETPLPFAKPYGPNGAVMFEWPRVEAWFLARCDTDTGQWRPPSGGAQCTP